MENVDPPSIEQLRWEATWVFRFGGQFRSRHPPKQPCSLFALTADFLREKEYVYRFTTLMTRNPEFYHNWRHAGNPSDVNPYAWVQLGKLYNKLTESEQDFRIRFTDQKVSRPLSKLLL
jgi:hypothetical protein